MGALEVYVLSVGEGDSAIIKTPLGNVIVIDAYKWDKVKHVLDKIAPKPHGGTERVVSHLIVTHPHTDHYSAAGNVLSRYTVRKVTLAPFWYRLEEQLMLGGPQYKNCINKVLEERIPLRFLGGYQRSYPDVGQRQGDEQYDPYNLPNEVCLELLGPPNDLLEELEEAQEKNKGIKILEPNHLSIMARLSHEQFSMVFAADAQMENWAHYDRAGMLEKGCKVLKAAHHGSMNGTQWERLHRLEPKMVIVSSKRHGKHNLPDLIGSTTFWKYERTYGKGKVALTETTGTIKITISDPAKGTFDSECYLDQPGAKTIPWEDPQDPLPFTDWAQIAHDRWKEQANEP
ncbi:MAG: hypothetical protein AMJ93_08205 [Anaerolineae bacterium SM23_84]|jgi:beta-lactamase superfamily II metal-dependent hydrolase|nr:MAG: hypothetical protein AMJ93_08205 [Anaerolineae bacterium SM23_84]